MRAAFAERRGCANFVLPQTSGLPEVTQAPFARIAQLVEHNLAKVGVASSNLVSRSTKASHFGGLFSLWGKGFRGSETWEVWLVKQRLTSLNILYQLPLLPVLLPDFRPSSPHKKPKTLADFPPISQPLPLQKQFRNQSSSLSIHR